MYGCALPLSSVFAERWPVERGQDDTVQLCDGNRILMCNQVCIRARAAHTRLARLHGHRDWHPQGTIMRGQCPGVLELCERYAETFSVLIRSDGSVGRVAFVPRWVTRETGPAI